MRFRRKIIKVSLVFCILAGLAIASMLWRKGSPEGSGSSGIGIFLARPAFAQEGEMSFLEKEAGIAAYTDLGQKIDLTAAKTVFRTVEKETGVYVLGSVPVPGYGINDDIHCFIHKEGWIVAYYLRDEPTSKIMYWKNWDGKTISTKVEQGLASVAGTTGLAPTDVKYFHFKYPHANKLGIIADNGSFKLTIPSELVIHERSYSMSASNSLYIDEGYIKGDCGLIAVSQLRPDVSHIVREDGSGSAVIVLVYQEL